MGTAVATQRSLWLSLAKLTDREKAPLLDAPVCVQGVFGKAVDTMAAKFEEQQKSREAFQAWMPRSSSPHRDTLRPHRARSEAGSVRQPLRQRCPPGEAGRDTPSALQRSLQHSNQLRALPRRGRGRPQAS